MLNWENYSKVAIQKEKNMSSTIIQGSCSILILNHAQMKAVYSTFEICFWKSSTAEWVSQYWEAESKIDTLTFPNFVTQSFNLYLCTTFMVHVPNNFDLLLQLSLTYGTNSFRFFCAKMSPWGAFENLWLNKQRSVKMFKGVSKTN